jgi:NAD(P)H-hydrate epimerase
MDIPFITELPVTSDIDAKYSFIVDAIFGFSFKGNIREPFGTIIDTLKAVKTPLCSVDVPSGIELYFV